jgi:hypothetical protein
MIDTLGVQVGGKLKCSISQKWKREGWSEGFQGFTGKITHGPSGFLKHPETGLRVRVSLGEVVWAEVELSRLLRPHNGYLLKTQEELDQAIRRFKRLLGEVCDLSHEQHFAIRRIDLVGHAQIAPQTLISVYKNFRLPGFRKDPVNYPGESLFWKGRKRKCRIYDKQFKHARRQGDVTRIEWELHGLAIVSAFGQVLSLEALKIEKCYQAFLRLSRGFQPKALSKKAGVVEILAMAEASGASFEGVPLIEHIRHTRNPRAFRQLMRRTVNRQLKFMRIDLADYFPENFEAYQSPDVPLTFKKRG